VIVCLRHGGWTQHRHGTGKTSSSWPTLMMLRGQYRPAGRRPSAPLRGPQQRPGATGRWASPRFRPRRFLSVSTLPSALPRPAAAHGHDAVEAIAAMRDGAARAFIGLGGKPRHRDVGFRRPCFPAFRRLGPVGANLHQAEPHVPAHRPGRSIVLPCLGRTERDCAGERSAVGGRSRIRCRWCMHRTAG